MTSTQPRRSFGTLYDESPAFLGHKLASNARFLRNARARSRANACAPSKIALENVCIVLEPSHYKKYIGDLVQVKTIEIVKPTEDVGRDTLSRYDMQFQAAAYAALQILEGKGVDCVYCDFHDDFVVRRIVAGKTTYHFFQVKTKKKLNHQWSLNEVFALKKRGQKADPESLKQVRES